MKRAGRGVSPLVSLVITTSITLAIIVAIAYYAAINLELTVEQAEFDKARAALSTLRNYFINSISSGEGGSVEIPSRTLIFEFVDLDCELIINVSQTTTLVVKRIDQREIAVYGGPLASVPEATGSSSLVVESPLDIVSLSSGWDSDMGRPYAKLNFSRVSIRECEYAGFKVLEVTYLNVTRTISGSSGVVVVHPAVFSISEWNVSKLETLYVNVTLDGRANICPFTGVDVVRVVEVTVEVEVS